MLRPQDNAARERKNLSGLWAFRLDADGAGREAEWWRGALPGAREMPVPASYNDIVPGNEYRDHVGDAWYQTSVHVPASWAGGRVVLRFDAATHRAVVWVGETRVAEHEGGYTPFEADVTGHVDPGRPCRITVVVNNELTHQSIPPGTVEDTPAGRRQRTRHDFFNYAGLHRPVWLYRTPAAHIADITVVTGLDGADGTVAYRVDVDGLTDETVRATMRDAAGAVVATGEGVSGDLRVTGVHPWAPGDGYLYDFQVELIDGRGAGDTYHLPVGVRTVRVDGDRFLINGRPFRFTGFGKHEDAAVRGKAHDDALMTHDFALMEWIGANSFRTSHYPYAEEVLEYADRHGVVVIDETAAVGLNLSFASDLFGLGGRPTFADDALDARTQAVHLAAIRELITRDKNHPSVVVWSIANEPESNTPEARDYFAPLFDAARTLDPTRPVGFVSMQQRGDCLVTPLADVSMINRYFGWYSQPGDLASAEAALESDLTDWAGRYGKPVIVTEYGADTISGLHAVADTPWTEEYQSRMLEMYHHVLARTDGVVGGHVWNFADFATNSSFFRVAGNKKGVFTRDRQPKAAAFTLRRLWREDV